MDDQQSARKVEPRKGSQGQLLAFGIILPITTLALEMASHMCANLLFDPIPTLWHVLMVALTPVAGMLALRWAVGDPMERRHARLTGFFLGIAGMVAVFYALVFLPTLPAGIFGLIVFLGIFLLAPILCAIVLWGVALPMVLRVAENVERGRIRLGLGFGIAAGFALILTSDYAANGTRMLTAKARSDDEASRGKAIAALRTKLHQQQLLKLAYDLERSVVGPISFFTARGLTQSDAQLVYFQVTGTPWSETPRPERLPFWAWDNPDFSFPNDPLAGRSVGRDDGTVFLEESGLVGEAISDFCVGYCEWTMQFRNRLGNRDQEARFRLKLPPGGVVSRVSLWVDGEPREAAFDRRAKVQGAYQALAVRPPVGRARDPLLVTASGPDEVMVQCFPIPRGGTMKIRIGMTYPIMPLSTDPTRGRFGLPRITEQNFTTSGDLVSSGTISVDSEVLSAPDGWVTGPGGTTRNHSLLVDGGTFELSLPRVPSEMMASETSRGIRISGTVQSHTIPDDRPLFVVVDASARMASGRMDLDAAMETISRRNPTSWFVAGDGVVEVESLEDVTRTLDRIGLVDGRDNSPALSKAMHAAENAGGGSVVWFHGPQEIDIWPLELPDGKLRTTVYTKRIVPGGNRVLEQLEQMVPTLSANVDSTSWRWETSPMGLQALKPPPPYPAEAHVARLWAADSIRRDVASEPEWATRLGKDYGLVTPLTGAVVLETAQQYLDHELTPVDPASIPALPEPRLIMLLIAGTATVLLLMLVKSWRRQCCQ